jgi:hypothetical protein
MFNEFGKKRSFTAAATAVLIALFTFADLAAQRPRFGDSFVIPNAQIGPPLIGTAPAPQQGAAATVPVLPQNNNPATGGFSSVYGPPLQQTNPGGIQQPPPTFPQQTPSPATGPPVLIQRQVFDPFATQPGSFSQGAPPPGAIMPANPSAVPPPFIYPMPAGGPPVNPSMGPPNYGAYQPGAYPWYNANNGASSNSPVAWPNEFWNRIKSSEVYRLLERPRWRHTYIAPSGDRYLGWNESEIATTLTIPNFLFTAQPLRLSPGFVFNFWEGPDTVITGVDLPARTYDAFLAADYSTPWDRAFGIETNVTVGVYSDFNHVTTDSIRITGLGLGWVRLNNTTTFKVGIEYLDRLSIKLLPAIGVFIYPNADLKLDVYFPRPRLAHRLPSLGNYEVWGYLGGEYGGGSWTVERLGPMSDQVDVNDIRVFGGLEWMGPRQVTGFLEAGYVFQRELIFKSAPGTEVDIDNSYMLRAGIAF